MSNGSEIKMVYGTQRAIRRAIDALVAAHKPVYHVETKRAGIFWHIAMIKTDKAHDVIV